MKIPVEDVPVKRVLRIYDWKTELHMTCPKCEAVIDIENFAYLDGPLKNKLTADLRVIDAAVATHEETCHAIH